MAEFSGLLPLQQLSDLHSVGAILSVRMLIFPWVYHVQWVVPSSLSSPWEAVANTVPSQLYNQGDR